MTDIRLHKIKVVCEKLPQKISNTTVKLTLTMLEEILINCGYMKGAWRLRFVSQLRQKSTNKFKVVRQDGRAVRIRCKPGNNATAWEALLTPPDHVLTQDATEKLQAIHGKKLTLGKLAVPSPRSPRSDKKPSSNGKPQLPPLNLLLSPTQKVKILSHGPVPPTLEGKFWCDWSDEKTGKTCQNPACELIISDRGELGICADHMLDPKWFQIKRLLEKWDREDSAKIDEIERQKKQREETEKQRAEQQKKLQKEKEARLRALALKEKEEEEKHRKQREEERQARRELLAEEEAKRALDEEARKKELEERAAIDKANEKRLASKKSSKPSKKPLPNQGIDSLADLDLTVDPDEIKEEGLSNVHVLAKALVAIAVVADDDGIARREDAVSSIKSLLGICTDFAAIVDYTVVGMVRELVNNLTDRSLIERTCRDGGTRNNLYKLTDEGVRQLVVYQQEGVLEEVEVVEEVEDEEIELASVDKVADNFDEISKLVKELEELANDDAGISDELGKIADSKLTHEEAIEGISTKIAPLREQIMDLQIRIEEHEDAMRVLEEEAASYKDLRTEISSKITNTKERLKGLV
jgi:hypothetical protein